MENIKIARIISRLCEAPFLAIPAFLIINLFLEKSNFLLIESVSFLFSTVLPILIVFGWGYVFGIDVDYTNKNDRQIPLFIGVVSFFIGTYILSLLNANYLTVALMFCYGFNTLLVFLITFKWKISIHAMGTAGPTLALMLVNPLFFVYGLIGPIVMWARLTLKKHTVSQVIVGSSFGYIVTIFILRFLFNIKFSLTVLILVLILLVIPILLYITGIFKNH